MHPKKNSRRQGVGALAAAELFGKKIGTEDIPASPQNQAPAIVWISRRYGMARPTAAMLAELAGFKTEGCA